MAFLLSFGSEGMGTGFGLHYAQFPCLWLRSSVSRQAPVSHSAAHSMSQPETSEAHGSPLLLSPSVQCQTKGVQVAHFLSATRSGCMQCETGGVHGSAWLLSLGVHCQTGGEHSSPPPLTLSESAEISLVACQLLLGSSLQSSYLPFLPRAWIFTQLHFSNSLETESKSDMAQLLPSPGVAQLPNFCGCQRPQYQCMCTASVCLPLHLYFPQ